MSRGPYPVMLVLAMALPGAARALGLGEIRVDSQLNEPLSAQIDIVGATRDDLAALTAKVAGREIFQRYGADRPAFLSSATFKVGLDAEGHPVLNIRSTDAFTDPVIDFLVDISWGKGELIREYSLLLDPPGFPQAARTTEFAAAASAAAAHTASVAAPPATATMPSNPTPVPGALSVRAPNAAPPAMAPAPMAAAATAPAMTAPAAMAPAVTVTAPLLRVAAGDTLRGIARRAGARGEADTERLMIAIYRANPHAFEGNINLLHRGALLRIPSQPDVAAIDTAVATREVRAQTTAWRKDSRSAGLHPVAAAATSAGAARAPAAERSPAEDKSSADALRLRVQSLEQALDAMHRDLAAKTAKIQDLKQLTAAPAASQPTAPLPQSSQSTAPLAAASPAAPLATAPLAAASQPTAPLATAPLAAAAPSPAPAPVSGTPLHAELMQAQAHPAPVHAPAAAPPPAQPLVNTAQLGSMAAALVLMLAGFAYVRRRLGRAGASLPQTPIAYVPPDTSAIERPEPRGPGQQPVQPVAAPPALGPELPEHAAKVVAPDPTADTAPLAVLAGAPDATAPLAVPDTGHAAALDTGRAAALDTGHAGQALPTHPPGLDDTDAMGIDTHALERSYLEGLTTDSTAVDTATHEAVPYDPATHEAVPLDVTGTSQALPHAPAMAAAHDPSDPLAAPSELSTLLLEAPKTDPHKADLAPQGGAALDSAALDYDPLDLDATAHHVHMSGNLHDQAPPVERRTTLVDVLKSAIERDPHRRDLVLKLLETYYSAVSTNQRAFLDVARKLPRDLNFLTKEDWRKVEAMGRDIAPSDPLFAVDLKGDLLPSFA